MDLPLSDFRRMEVEEFDTSKLLAHAAQQATERGYKNFPIVDVDSHHYESESIDEILEYMDDPVLQQLARSARQASAKSVGMLPAGVGYQDMGGRVMRYAVRGMEKTEPGVHRDIALTRRWMDAIGIDVAVMFPTPMLQLGLHPQVEVEVALARAYNRWLTERVLAHEPRIRSMLYLPFNDADAAFKMVQEFGQTKGVVGFMVTSARYQPGASQFLHEDLCADGRDGPAASVSCRLQLERPDRRHDEPLHLGARARLRLLQHGASRQLDHQRPAGAVSQAEGAVGRKRARLGAVHDAALRQRIHDALVGGAGAEETAERLYARHVLLLAADGNDRHGGAGANFPHDQGGNASCSIRPTIRTGISICPRPSTTCRS